MAGRTGIRDVIVLRSRRRYKAEGMAAHIDVGNRSRNLWHVAIDALSVFRIVVTMLDIVSTRARRRVRPVTSLAYRVARLDQLSAMLRSVHVVAVPAANAVRVHGARDIVVALHTVLVCRTIRPVGERRFTQEILFEPPVVGQAIAWLIPDRPVVIDFVQWGF